MAQQRLIEAELAAQNAQRLQKEEEEKKAEEEVSKTRKFGRKLKSFFKDDVGGWITAAANGIAGPPIAAIGMVSDEIADAVASDDEEEDLNRARRARES